MAEEAIQTPAQEVNAEQQVTAPEPNLQDVDAATTADTISEVMQPTQVEKKQPDGTVPLHVYEDMRSQMKEYKKSVEDLRQRVEAGATKREIAQDIKDIAEEHNVDVDFLQKFAENVASKVERDVESKISPRLKAQEAEQEAARIEKIFTAHFTKAMETMPELNGVVNRDVIKQLSLLPQNAKKTFAQLIEETYAGVPVGRKTMERTKGKTGQIHTGEIDFNRAKSDQDYFKEIMADPNTKREYNESLVKRINL